MDTEPNSLLRFTPPGWPCKYADPSNCVAPFSFSDDVTLVDDSLVVVKLIVEDEGVDNVVVDIDDETVDTELDRELVDCVDWLVNVLSVDCVVGEEKSDMLDVDSVETVLKLVALIDEELLSVDDVLRLDSVVVVIELLELALDSSGVVVPHGTQSSVPHDSEQSSRELLGKEIVQ